MLSDDRELDMNSLHDAANKKRSAATDQIRQSYTTHALAGLRRPYYTGVFRKVKGATEPNFLAEIKLDGFERNIAVRVTARRDEKRKLYFQGLLSGLRLKSDTRHFKLTPGNTAPNHYHGTIALHQTRLIISVLSILSVTGTPIHLCLLEIVEEMGDVPCHG